MILLPGAAVPVIVMFTFGAVFMLVGEVTVRVTGQLDPSFTVESALVT